MPGRKNASLKDPELYEELRDDGASKEKAARISNAAAAQGRSAIGRKGGKHGDYEDWTVEQLRKRAKELGITGLQRQAQGRAHLGTAQPLSRRMPRLRRVEPYVSPGFTRVRRGRGFALRAHRRRHRRTRRAGAHRRPRRAARLGGRVDRGCPERAHPRGRRRRRRAPTVPLPPGLAREAGRGEVPAHDRARRGAARGTAHACGGTSPSRSSRASACSPRRSARSTSGRSGSAPRSRSRASAAAASRPCSCATRSSIRPRPCGSGSARRAASRRTCGCRMPRSRRSSSTTRSGRPRRGSTPGRRGGGCARRSPPT